MICGDFDTRNVKISRDLSIWRRNEKHVSLLLFGNAETVKGGADLYLGRVQDKNCLQLFCMLRY